ncbi:FtsX-like permease family protein [Mesobacterium sp. TK19101]|uniref:FtsX-like permease family protein n=1 Tax=Mesobacterium hydrothermale TaxID=3111907 RepID=A0ABU6HDW1_9RHOB|nr:FtsX-like permease family protein [Mesobacterium sp. TK19101]MEC3859824.1 FtsX-like permease family protein [Mesobacterium sp. TK19101]
MARAVLARDAAADRVVPPAGFTVRLTLLAAAAMAFLAVFALALSLAAGRIASRWGDELARSSTIRISAPAEEADAQTAAAIRVLETTPGILSARALSDAEQQALLEPWFGPDIPIADLPVPRLIEVVETEDGYDGVGLRLRLSAEVPGAVLDDHSRWRRPLVTSAARLRLLGWVSILLIAAATAAMVTLAAHAALAANAKVITVLRLVGATDNYIAGAFVRRFTLRALTGAAVGAVLAVVAVLLLPGDSDGVLTGVGFQGLGWVWPVLVPLLIAMVAFGATQAAARRVLEGLS